MAELPSTHSDPARFILHPTDFSPESEQAFAHALRLALTNKANLALLHVDEGDEDSDWERFPAVRETLERWGLIDPGAARSDVAQLGIGVEKLVAKHDTVADAVVDHLFRRTVDMLVLATHGRRGLSAWLHPSIAEQTARRSPVPTLFVPTKGRGCVSLETGEVCMRHVVIPVDHHPPAGDAIERGLRAIAAYGDQDSKLTLLHVGDSFPEVSVPDGPWQVDRVTRTGNPVKEILEVAHQQHADVLAMVTEGSHGFLDMLRGTTTEQVLHEAECPILSIPANF